MTLHRNKPDDPQLKKWVEDLHENYGPIEQWPKIGCGSTNVPWAKGKSQVVEVRMSDGTFFAFAAARMPAQLGIEIQKKKQEFYMAARDLTPEALKDLIPVTFPVTHTIPGFPFISRYPIDSWEEQGAPAFSTQPWYKLAMCICRNDMTNLGNVYEFAERAWAKL